MRQVVVTDAEFETLDRERAVLGEIGVQVLLSPSPDEQVLTELCRDAEGIAVQNGPLTGAVIRELHRCRVIVSYGIGYDSIDVQAASLKGIPVANVPGFCEEEVADSAMMLLLAVSRKLVRQHQSTLGDATPWGYKPFVPIRRLRGKTLGIVGFSRVGRAVAVRAQAFGMRVIASDPYVRPEILADFGVEAVALRELLRDADFLSLHLALTPETRGLIGEAELKMMRPTAYLINTARGAIVDSAALAQALEKGWIAGAALDVFSEEPLQPGTRASLRQLPNLLVTPHTAWYSEEALAELQDKVAWTLRRALEGRTPPNVVNPEALARAAT